MATITSGDWWKAAAARAFRTAAVVAIPYLPVALSGAEYLVLASAFGMGFVLSILTSLAGIAEVEGQEVPWWYATLSRVVKTVAQALVAAVGSAVLFTDVNWSTIPALVVSSAIGSLLLAVVKQLPEAPTPVAPPSGATPVEIVAVSPEAAALTAAPATTNIVVSDPKEAADVIKEVAESIHTANDYHGV
jgi:hypothetical protein